MRTLTVSIPEQEVKLHQGSQLLATYPVSTSKFGLGTEEGSNKTPLGEFRICEKYGTHAPELTVFKGRKAQGVWTSDNPIERDYVLTKILRLEGSQPGLENTYGRYIYFHGTNQEELIGTPASHGCIRLRNADMSTLFTQVSVGTTVRIQNSLAHE